MKISVTPSNVTDGLHFTILARLCGLTTGIKPGFYDAGEEGDRQPAQ